MEVRTMPYARQFLVCLEDTTYYHVTSRCVRSSWLWGHDEKTGRDYTHRKQWIIQRLQLLTETFAIDVCAHSIMSNHYHLALHVDRTRAQHWSASEVAARWEHIYRVPARVQQWLQGQGNEADAAFAQAKIERWRTRLHNLSWFMRCLNEHLARRANVEDGCKGRFWEGRFSSRALLDEAGLLTAMAYVDLNPIRAGIAKTPEESEFTSIYERIRQHKSAECPRPTGAQEEARITLLPFQSEGAACVGTLPFTLEAYLELVDWTGRRVVQGKAAMDAEIPPILQRLNIDAETWVRTMQPRGNVFGRAIGRLTRLREHAVTVGQAWIRGLGLARRLYCA
jgi:REP element-mobilizing transposase RayT